MGKKVTVKIRKIAYSKLRKLEVYTFYNIVLDVISRYDTKAMRINNACDVLITMQPKAELLKLTDDDLGPHLLTPEVDSLHERRLKFAAIITNQMRILEKADIKEKRHMVELAKHTVYRYLNYLRQNDKVTIESSLNGFFIELRNMPEIKDALCQLGLETYLNELEAAKSAYTTTCAKRTKQQSQSPKGSTTPVQRELQYVMDILFNQVNFYQHVYKDIDYSGLITALNHTIAIYTKKIKTRDTQRKNKKIKAEDNIEAPSEENTKIDGIDKSLSDTTDTTSATLSPTEVKENHQKISPPASTESLKGREKPTNGSMDILNKKDREEKEEDDRDL